MRSKTEVLLAIFDRIMDLRKDRKRSLKVLEQQEAEIERIEATRKGTHFKMF